MQLNRNLTLDINPKAQIQSVFVKQHDAESNVFTVSFINSETKEDIQIAAGQTVNFRCKKPSGLGCIYECENDGSGTVTLTLSAESTAEFGLTLADLSIEENGVILSTAAFWLRVMESGVSDNIGGSNEYVELENTIEEAKALIAELEGGAIIECEDANDDGNVVIRFTKVDP